MEKEYIIDLVGTGADGKAVNHEMISEGETVKLIRERDNPYDSNAIGVITVKNKSLGYLPAYLAAKLAPVLEAGKIHTNVTVVSSTPLSMRGPKAKNRS